MTRESSAVESVRRALAEEIDSGAIPPGARLGNERDLATQYGVSRATLRQVLVILEQSGLVRRVPGRGGGTFVGQAKVERDLSVVSSVPSILMRQGYEADTRILSTRIAEPAPRVRHALGLDEDELVVEIRRIRLANGEPISLDYAIFSDRRFPGLLEQSLGGSIYELLREKYNTVPDQTDEEIEVVHALDEESTLLSVDADSPLLLIRRVAYDSDGNPFEYSKDLFRSDRTRIRMRTHGRGIQERPVQDGDVLVLWSGADDTSIG